MKIGRKVVVEDENNESVNNIIEDEDLLQQEYEEEQEEEQRVKKKKSKIHMGRKKKLKEEDIGNEGLSEIEESLRELNIKQQNAAKTNKKKSKLSIIPIIGGVVIIAVFAVKTFLGGSSGGVKDKDVEMNEIQTVILSISEDDKGNHKGYIVTNGTDKEFIVWNDKNTKFNCTNSDVKYPDYGTAIDLKFYRDKEESKYKAAEVTFAYTDKETVYWQEHTFSGTVVEINYTGGRSILEVSQNNIRDIDSLRVKRSTGVTSIFEVSKDTIVEGGAFKVGDKVMLDSSFKPEKSATYHVSHIYSGKALNEKLDELAGDATQSGKVTNIESTSMNADDMNLRALKLEIGKPHATSKGIILPVNNYKLKLPKELLDTGYNTYVESNGKVLVIKSTDGEYEAKYVQLSDSYKRPKTEEYDGYYNLAEYKKWERREGSYGELSEEEYKRAEYKMRSEFYKKLGYTVYTSPDYILGENGVLGKVAETLGEDINFNDILDNKEDSTIRAISLDERECLAKEYGWGTIQILTSDLGYEGSTGNKYGCYGVVIEKFDRDKIRFENEDGERIAASYSLEAIK